LEAEIVGEVTGSSWRVFLLVLAVLIGCEGSADDGALDYDPAACTAFTLPTGLGLSWENLNHRISLWQLQLEPSPAEACATDTLSVAYIGGDYSTGETLTDTPSVAWDGLRVTAAGPEVLGVARARLELEVGPTGVATKIQSLERASLALSGYPTVVAFVEGLRLVTDVPQGADYPSDYDPAHGYTSRGIGAGARVLTLTPESLELEGFVRFAHGPSERPDMNAALAVATTRATLDLVLVGLPDGAARTGEVAYHVDSEPPPAWTDVPSQGPTAEQVQVEIQGPPGAHAGLYGWTRFRFELDPLEAEGMGYYVRDLHISLTLDELDEARGLARFSARGYASNASKFLAFYGMGCGFEGALAWIPADLTVTPVAQRAPFETGSASFPLEAAP
jgi:hypothetical protein